MNDPIINFIQTGQLKDVKIGSTENEIVKALGNPLVNPHEGFFSYRKRGATSNLQLHFTKSLYEITFYFFGENDLELPSQLGSKSKIHGKLSKDQIVAILEENNIVLSEVRNEEKFYSQSLILKSPSGVLLEFEHENLNQSKLKLVKIFIEEKGTD